jgi:hypothetical protein
MATWRDWAQMGIDFLCIGAFLGAAAYLIVDVFGTPVAVKATTGVELAAYVAAGHLAGSDVSPYGHRDRIGGE